MEPFSIRKIRLVGSEALCRVRPFFPAEISCHRRGEITPDSSESPCFDTSPHLHSLFWDNFNLRLASPNRFLLRFVKYDTNKLMQNQDMFLPVMFWRSSDTKCFSPIQSRATGTDTWGWSQTFSGGRAGKHPSISGLSPQMRTEKSTFPHSKSAQTCQGTSKWLHKNAIFHLCWAKLCQSKYTGLTSSYDLSFN